MLEELFELQIETLRTVDQLPFKRYLFDQIDWKSRMLAITGSRGTGKTTLLLQYYLDNYDSPEKCLYISADNIRVITYGMFNSAVEFFKFGGERLMIDEIHKYPNWSQELKNIYDTFPTAKICISGSSTAAIIKGKSDLSRRVVIYNLKGLSFREFLELETKSQFNKYTLKELLKDHVKIAGSISAKAKVLQHFKHYLMYGYYPFFLEGRDVYDGKLNNVVDKILYEDIPNFFGIKASSIPILKKLIYLVATSQPFSPNIEKISQQLGISKEYIYNFLEYLEKAGIFLMIYPEATGFKLIRKAKKIYLENPNLFYAFLGKDGLRAEEGAIRETFLVNQLKDHYGVLAHESADFSVDGKYVFEVGGKNKDRSQIKGSKNAYILADNIEIGSNNKIPLWLIGFLY